MFTWGRFVFRVSQVVVTCLAAHVNMSVYVIDSQVPELKPLTREHRRMVFRRAVALMSLRSPFFCWLPTFLCALGGLAGALLGSGLLGRFHPGSATMGVYPVLEGFVWMYSGVGIGAVTAGYVGLHFQRRKLRPYLRNVIEAYGPLIYRSR